LPRRDLAVKEGLPHRVDHAHRGHQAHEPTH
jgi:hypothetical protein